MNKLKEKKFTMDDVAIAHSLKPYLPVEKFIKQFAFLNYKISKGWTMEKIVNKINNGSLNVSVSNVRK
jgi:hypothetical protein